MSPAPRSTPVAGPTLVDAVLAVVVGAAAFALYATTRQWRIYGDGPMLLRSVTHEPDGDATWIHAAYLPIARWWNGALDWTTPAEALRFLSVTSGAVVVGGTFVLARAFGAGRVAALAAAALFAVTPALWFYSAQIEVHALHAAAVVAVALVTWFAPWRRPALALAIVAFALPLLHLTHQSGATLHLAWIALAFFAWRRVGGDAVGPRQLVLVVAPVMTAALAVALLVSDAWQSDASFADLDGLGGFVSDSRIELTGRRLAGMWGWPIGWAWLALVVAPFAPRPRREAGVVALLAALPLLAFFTWLGVPERGAYALGFLPFALAFAAVGVDELARVRMGTRGRGALLVAAVLLVALQAHLGATRNAEVDNGSWRARSEERAAFLRTLADGPLHVVSANRSFQLIETASGTIREVNLVPQLKRAANSGVPLPLVQQQIVLVLDGLGASSGQPVVLDLGHRQHLEHAPELVPLLEAIEEGVRANYAIEEHADGERLYWVLGPRSESASD